MLYVKEILQSILYYLDFMKYFNEICNYLDQYHWHNNLLVSRSFYISTNGDYDCYCHIYYPLINKYDYFWSKRIDVVYNYYWAVYSSFGKKVIRTRTGCKYIEIQKKKRDGSAYKRCNNRG
jgi:hypothetical protein